MLHKITPQEEKAVLEYTLADNGLGLSYNSMAEVMNDKELPIGVKEYVVLDCLSYFFKKIIFNIDTYTSIYETYKALYTKYANQDLFRAIGGISLTLEDIEELNSEQLAIVSLFFDIYKDKASFEKIFPKIDITDYTHIVLLMPSLYEFTEDKVQEIIANEVGITIFFAASPYTKDFLTKENFYNANELLTSYSEEESLKEAYYDLFGESLTVG